MSTRSLNIPTVLIICMICFILVVSTSPAQTDMLGSITGIILDNDNGEPLYGVNVILKGTVLGAATDQDGRFEILRLTPGTYDIEASMIGYRKGEQSVRISSGAIVEITIRLESTIIEQPALIVTASKRKQHIEDAPTSVDVVTAKEIQRRSAVTLDQVLQHTAGMTVIDGQIDLRGSTGFNWTAGSRVLLMIDGHPFISGDNGGINWDAIPVDEISRVEVVKGAGSALYGSNAMAGMVNIITRDPSPTPMTRFKLSYGFYDEPAYPEWRWSDEFLTTQIQDGRFDPFNALAFEGIDISHSRTFGNIGILFTAGRKSSRGYYQNGEYSRWNAMLKAKVRLSANRTLTVKGNYSLNDHGDFIQWRGSDQPLLAAVDEVGYSIWSQKQNLHLTFQHGVNKRLAYTLKANVYRYHWQNHYLREGEEGEDAWAKTDRLGTEAQFDYILGKQTLTFGTEATIYHTNSLMYGDRDAFDISLYAEDEIKPSPLLTFTLGTRFDYHWVRDVPSDQQISPRFGMVYRPWEGTSLRLSAGHGFRAPSIAEVFANIQVSGLTVIPNPDLHEAERAWSAEFGIRQVLPLKLYKGSKTASFSSSPVRWAIENFNPAFILDAAVFWSRYRNIIDVDITSGLTTAVQFKNLGAARIMGAELRLQGTAFARHLTASVGYTLLDPENLDTGKTLNYRSRHRLNLNAELRVWKLIFGWDYRYASRMDEIINVLGSAFDERVPMHVMDARITLDFNAVQIILEGKNLRNYHYNLRQRFLEPMRHFVMTMRGSF